MEAVVAWFHLGAWTGSTSLNNNDTNPRLPLTRPTHPLPPSADLFNDDFSYKRKLKIKLPTPDGVVRALAGIGRGGTIDAGPARIHWGAAAVDDWIG